MDRMVGDGENLETMDTDFSGFQLSYLRKIIPVLEKNHGIRTIVKDWRDKEFNWEKC